jgi:hypothetical protein
LRTATFVISASWTKGPFFTLRAITESPSRASDRAR